MSFRTFTRVPMAAARIPLRMMSDAPEIRTYVGYSLYKMKGALNIKPIPATLKIENNQKTIARDGTLLFEFAPSGKGPREYDWTKKLTFSLSPTELGEVVRMKDTDTTSFMHNPNAGAENKDNSVVKKFSLTPVADGKGVFASLHVTDKNANPSTTSLSVMITWAELEVIKTIGRYCIPRFLGMDLVV